MTGRRSTATRWAIVAVLMTGCTVGRSEGTTGLSPPSTGTTGPTFSSSRPRAEVAPVHSMTTPRASHTATTLRDGLVLIAGGFDDAGGDEASAELFDPRTATFEPTGAMSIGRQSHTATLLDDARVLIAGGYDPDGNRLATAEIYDPATRAFSVTGSMTGPRADHTATLLRDGRVLIAGGTGPGFTFLASAEIYDPARGTFRATGPLSVGRESATATLLRDGRVLIAGGHSGRHEAITIYALSEVYDPSTGRFTRVDDLNVARHKHDAVLLDDGRVLIVGGSDARDDAGLYDSAEIFDPTTGTFSLTGTLHEARYKMRGTSLLLADGRALVCCGAPDAEIFDPRSTDFAIVPGGLGAGPLFAASARVGPEEVLVTGGYSLSGPATADAWLIRV
jgi:Galactose oxidase, central domain